MILLLDTTVLIDTLRSLRGRRPQLAALVERGHTLATSVINIAEVYAGVRPQEQQQTDSFLRSLEAYQLTSEIARRAGLLKNEFGNKGKTLSLADMMIAATALEHGLTLMTDNRKDFLLPGVNIYGESNA